MFTNKHSYDFYIEKYKSIKINISPTENQNGILYTDIFNNSLFSTLNVGISPITKIVGYSSNYPNSLLIYDDNNFTLCKDYVTSGTNKFYPIIHPNLPVKYKINAKLDRVMNMDDSTFFSLNLTGRSVFKVKLNNKYITNYLASSSGITVNEVLDPFENEIEVVHYITNQAITQPFYLTYDGVEVRYDLTLSTCNNDFFSNMTKIELFIDFSDSISKTIVENSNIRLNNENKIFTETNNTLTMNLPDGRFELLDVLNNSKKFRILAYDYNIDKLIYWCGCTINNGVGFSVSETLNSNNISIDFEDRVSVLGVSPTNKFGEGYYNEGYYSIRTISANYGTNMG